MAASTNSNNRWRCIRAMRCTTQQAQDRADAAGNIDEGRHERQQQREIIPGRVRLQAVGHEHRAAQQQEPPTAENDRLLKLVQHDPLRAHRRGQQKLGLGRSNTGRCTRMMPDESTSIIISDAKKTL